MKIYTTLEIISEYQTTIQASNINEAQSILLDRIDSIKTGELTNDFDYEIMGFYNINGKYHFTIHIDTIYVTTIDIKYMDNIDKAIYNKFKKIEGGELKILDYTIIRMEDNEGEI